MAYLFRYFVTRCYILLFWPAFLSDPVTSVDLILSGISIRASPNIDIHGVRFDSKLTFEVHVRGIVYSCLSENCYFEVGVLLRFYYPFVLPILEYCPPMFESSAECHHHLLERQVYSVARLCPDRGFLTLCHWRHVAGLCMLYKVNSYSNDRLSSEHPSVCKKVRHCRAAH